MATAKTAELRMWVSLLLSERIYASFYADVHLADHSQWASAKEGPTEEGQTGNNMRDDE
jgi:hypothetical protein